jgi:hypothetical protein
MFFDKISDFSASFYVQYSSQLFITQDMTRTVNAFFSPHSQNARTFCYGQPHRLKDDRDSVVTGPAVSLNLIRLADRRQLHQIMQSSLRCHISQFWISLSMYFAGWSRDISFATPGMAARRAI